MYYKSLAKDMESGKVVTYSVRLPKKVAESFEKISELMQINKSDFLRACIEKLCNDNKLYLDHADKVRYYIDYIRDRMSKISRNKIIVENGSWETASDISILMLCDLLFQWTDEVFNLWFNTLVSYKLLDKEDFPDVKKYYSDGLILVEDIGFILSSSRVQTDVKELIEEELWWDELEIKRVSLLLATKKAIEKYSAEKLVDEVIERTSEREGEPTVIVVNAKGEFKRSGSTIVTPAEYKKISEI